MKLIALALFLSTASLLGQRNSLKPTDFVPLTSAPWTQPNATVQSIVKAIYLEPEARLRSAVLAEYLHLIPVEELGRAFDICTGLEGTQSPDDLVRNFLEVWGERDPKVCW